MKAPTDYVNNFFVFQDWDLEEHLQMVPVKKIHRIEMFDHELKKKNQLHLQMLFKLRVPSLSRLLNSDMVTNCCV